MGNAARCHCEEARLASCDLSISRGPAVAERAVERVLKQFRQGSRGLFYLEVKLHYILIKSFEKP